MLDFLRKALDLLMRFLDWRRDTKRNRAIDEANRAIAQGDRRALNAHFQRLRRDRR